MKINFPLTYTVEYLPSERHTKTRRQLKTENTKINIATITQESFFPIAYKVKRYTTVYPKVRDGEQLWELVHHGDQVNGIYFTETIRRYKKTLYRPIRHTYGSAIARSFPKPKEELAKRLEQYQNFCRRFSDWNEPDIPFDPEKSVVLAWNRPSNTADVQKEANKYVVFKGVLWEPVEEPLYTYTTFGCGNNHGGTGFFIEYGKRCNADRKIYWKANEREAAIKAAIKAARERGDTQYIQEIAHAKEMITKF
ncbi:hypothetical protein [Fibrobacter sp.]|uniref:hypothetical protein n=1 Tax=Fibrobacter sp. TaxID=35828 RepID=UPI0038645122